MIFGNKKRFAIEIKIGKDPNKGGLRLWLNSVSFGNFKRESEFIHVIYDANNFYRNFKLLYESCFDHMSIEEIRDYTLDESLIWSKNLLDLEEAERRQIYTRFLGDQFDGICSFISLYKDGVIIWIIWDNKETLKSFQTSFEDYGYAISEFKIWFDDKLSKYYS